jgi:translation initiation factor 3 subunit A
MAYQQRGHGAIQKPEYVLKRANDLLAISQNDREKKLALDNIHAHISLKRAKSNQQWNKTYEQLMKRHLELCVDLKDHYTARDGLHQYRNMVLRDDPNSLEVVISHLMELAEFSSYDISV